MIVKMKFLSISGPRTDIDRVSASYLSKYEMQLENAITELKTTDNLMPFMDVNPYKEPLSKAEQYVAMLAQPKGEMDTSLTADEILTMIRDLNHDYLDLKVREDRLKKQKEEFLERLHELEPFQPLELNLKEVYGYQYMKVRFGRVNVEYYQKLEKYLFDDLNAIFLEGVRNENYVYGCYIAAHKEFDVPRLENYVPLQVGAEGKERLGYLQDNTGDNISIKNQNFCELTGLYWIWKNTTDEYKGLVHYRRYFGKSNLSSKMTNVYTYDEMLGFLKGADIVLPYIEYFKQNAKEELLVECCTPEIFDELRRIVANMHPEYITAFDQYFAQNKSVLFNMMFCRAEIFDAYCEWLFSVLFELEKTVDLSKLNSYQKRLYGFLSERLLNVWLIKNNKKIRHVAIVNVEMPTKEKIVLLLRRMKHRYFS